MDTIMKGRFKKLHHTTKLIIVVSLLTILHFPSFEALAQSQQKAFRQFKFEHITAEDGFTHPVTRCMLQDRLGFLWFAGNLGLTRYDGYEFKKYPLEGDTNLASLGLQAILEGEDGKIWVGSSAGLHVFDPKTERFRNLTHVSQGKSENNVYRLYQSNNGLLWIGTLEGLKCFDPRKDEQLDYARKDGIALPFDTLRINAILEDKEGFMWIGTTDGLYKYDPSTGTILSFFHDPLDEKSISYNDIAFLMQDKYGAVWIATRGGGLNKYVSGNQFLHYRREKKGAGFMPSNRISFLLEGDGPAIWVGTRDNGLILFNSETESIEHYTYNPDDPLSIGDEAIWWMVEDDSGIIWIAQHGTVCKMDPLKSVFVNHKHQIRDPQSLSHNTACAFIEDNEGHIWVGTWGGGVNRYDPQTGLFQTFPFGEANSSHLLEPRICDLYMGPSGRLWISHFSGKLTYYDEGRFFPFDHQPDGSVGGGRISVRFMVEDDEQYLWYFHQLGMIKIHQSKGDYRLYQIDKEIPTKALLGVRKTQDGGIWLNSFDGLFRYEREEEVFRRVNTFGSEPALVPSTYEDEDGILWMGMAGKGLVRYDIKNDTYQAFGKEAGLSTPSIMCIVEDDRGRLWLSTEGGIFCFDKEKEKFSGYFIEDGLPDNAFLLKACCKSKQTGRVYFGGINGFTEFHPDSVATNTFVPPVRIINMHKYDQENQGLDINLLGEEGTQLSFQDQLVTFEFTAFDFHNPSKNQYQYQLQGQNEGWIDIGTKRELTFAKLDPGNYTLKIKGSNDEGAWGGETALDIYIAPPWYRTWWAYILWASLILGSIYWLYRFQLTRQLAQAEAQRLKELDHTKSQLYANITHEFRTPLTIILGMAEKVVDDPQDWFREGMRMINRNGQRLLHLVNQMLDLSKLESGTLPLKLVQTDIIAYLRYIHESFHSFAEANEISLHFLTDEEQLIMDYDPDKILEIVSNLVSNAIKYTPEGGRVYLQVEEIINGDHPALQLKVIDTGIGIAEKDLSSIFDRFYQVDDSSTRKGEGTGIGLALARELAKLLGGHIEADSQPGKGTTFTVILPIKREAPRVESPNKGALKSKIIPFTEKATTTSEAAPAAETSRPLLLVIEDNADVIQYLTSLLEKDYQLATATDGQTGINKAIELVPDIIISDVMMPEKDGFEVCDTLKQDERTSHIPIILLTAKADVESRLTGLGKGADAYLAKPFNKEELYIRLQKLVELRRSLLQRYSSLSPEEIHQHSDTYQIEDEFLIKVRTLVEEHLSDTEFDIVFLAKEVGMSRVQLYRKMKALTDKSPSIFVRTIRLSHAQKLLATSKLNISEVGYEVGFKDPAFFTRTFQNAFGKTPSEFRKEQD